MIVFSFTEITEKARSLLVSSEDNVAVFPEGTQTAQDEEGREMFLLPSESILKALPTEYPDGSGGTVLACTFMHARDKRRLGVARH